jgi:hypothetical protein
LLAFPDLSSKQFLKVSALLCRPSLAACVPVPENELVHFADDDPAWEQHPGIAAASATLADALEGLTKPAKL